MPLSDSGERIKFELQSFAAHNFNTVFGWVLELQRRAFSANDTCDVIFKG